MFYAFSYTDGTNTTTGQGRAFRAAGSLVSFKKKADRDAHVSTSSGHAGGGLIKALMSVDLPIGWCRKDAIELFLFEGKYCTEDEIILAEAYKNLAE